MKSLKSKTAKKLASISALGAGALVLAPQTADAGTIEYSGIINQTLHPGDIWAMGDNGTLKPPAFGLLRFNVFTSYNSFAGLQLGGHGFWFNTVGLRTVSGYSSPGFLKLVSPGAVQPFLYYSHFPHIASFLTGSGQLLKGGNGIFQNRLALFSFTRQNSTGGSSGYIHGWLRLSVNATSNPLNAELTVVDYAFDDSGALIAAGDTGAAPEPGTLASSGLAALVLGAEGLRRWRAARKKTAA